MIMVVIYRMKNIDLLLKRLRGGGIMITPVITPVNIYIHVYKNLYHKLFISNLNIFEGTWIK